jgi:excisionase family DNA binding protein
MTEAAKTLGVTNHALRRLIKSKILAATQVVPGAPFEIRASDLETDAVTAAIERKGRPCRITDRDTLPMFPVT